jgi:hypothetical protein
MENDFVCIAAKPFQVIWSRLIAKAPSFAAAFLLILAGLFFARVVRTLAEQVLQKARVDDAIQKVGVSEVLARLGLGKSLTYILGFLIYWFILFAFFVQAANAVNMIIVSELLERFMMFLPSVLAALLILFGGLMFGRFLSQVVSSAAAANDIRGGQSLSKAANAVIVVFSALLAMEQIGIQMLLIQSSIQIILASFGLAFALAFGLGGREIAAEILRDLASRKKQE